MARLKLHYCSFKMCHKKIVHRCLDCDLDFCSDHWAKRSTWGNFYLGDSKELVQIPYPLWQYLVCDRCCQKEHQISWFEFVRDFPFFLRHLKEKAQIDLCWKIFKQQRSLDLSYFEKARWARLYFPVSEDHLELETNLEEGFRFDDKLFPVSVFQRNFL